MVKNRENNVDNVLTRYIVLIYFHAFSKSDCYSIVKTKIIKLSSYQLKFFLNFYENSYQNKYWEDKWNMNKLKRLQLTQL